MQQQPINDVCPDHLRCCCKRILKTAHQVRKGDCTKVGPAALPLIGLSHTKHALALGAQQTDRARNLLIMYEQPDPAIVQYFTANGQFSCAMVDRNDM
jgi:hypothetical protein